MLAAGLRPDEAGAREVVVTQQLADAVGKRLVVTHQRICKFRRQFTSMREGRFHFKTTEATAPQAAAAVAPFACRFKNRDWKFPVQSSRGIEAPRPFLV